MIAFCFVHARALRFYFDLLAILLKTPLFLVKQAFIINDHVFSCVYDVFLFLVKQAFIFLLIV